MSEVMTFACDICQIHKQATNHWFRGYIVDDSNDRSVGVLIVPWDTVRTELFGPHPLPAKPDAHLCGEGHALEWASKVLSAKG